MSIIERRGMLAIGLYCATTIITLSMGVKPATTDALIGAPAPALTLTDSNVRELSLADSIQHTNGAIRKRCPFDLSSSPEGC
jgi:hypothetical protein